MKNYIITIDGPSGSGKSTVAKKVAQTLGFTFLDTGALYRAAAVAVEKAGCDIDNDVACGEVVTSSHIRMTGKKIELDNEDVTELIRSHNISEMSSRVAIHPSVRKALVKIQRSFSEYSSLVAEGRDTGSVVFPDADLKIFLDASAEERAQRRYRELLGKGFDITFEQVLKDIKKRDIRDTKRQQSPLVIPEHAVVVDTTHLKLEDVIKKILSIAKEKLTDQ